jgi:beta-galactosidase GanA
VNCVKGHSARFRFCHYNLSDMRSLASLTACGVFALSLLEAVNGAVTAKGAAPFTYNETTFLLHGEPFQILAGQMDPQRIPQQYWRDRLRKVRAMGLNSISSYIFWDLLEPKQDTWDFSGMNDVAQYFKIAQEEGLKVLLRPGSYICGEHTWGGFPAWLSEVPGMVVRSNNEAFLNATKSYITRLTKELQPLLVSNGGPIILVQVENEYGSYGSDKQYTSALRDMWKAAGFNVPLYTTDGDGTSYLKGGVIENVLAETDGGGGNVERAFVTRQNYLANTNSSGPYIDAEYYTTWLDLWGSPHQTTDANGAKTVMSDLDWLIKNGSSFSLYMVHGGTNFGFSAGADWSTVLTPVTSRQVICSRLNLKPSLYLSNSF